MSAATLLEMSTAAAAGTARGERSALLLDREISHIRAELANLTPAAEVCLQSVLDSILSDRALRPRTAAAARQLLQEITAAQVSRNRRGGTTRATTSSSAAR